MRIKDLLKKGMLIKETADISKSIQSIKVADNKFKEAKKSFDAEIYESTIIFSYTTMFHAARSLLFKEGYREKNHVAIIVFLEEKYEYIIGNQLINNLNTMRVQRHEGLYGLESDFTKEEAEHSLKIAKEFLKKIKELNKE